MTTPQGGFDLGNAQGSVTINANSAFSTLDRLQSRVSGFAGGLNRIGSNISSFGGGLTTSMLPVAGAFGVGIKAAGSFEDALIEIQARTGLTEESMESVRQKALQLGADTKFSSQQAAEAFLQLTTAGLSYEQTMTAIEPILQGAAAANLDLGTAADIATNVMSSFGLGADRVTDIMQVMSSAAASSPASMLEIGEALAQVGGDAKNFGLTLDQTGSALAILAKQGKRGTEAATQLRSMFTAMTSDTDKTQKAWDMVGSSLFDAEGNTRDFGVVLGEVKEGLKDLSAEDQAFVIQQLAGSYGRVGFNALLGSDGIEAMNDTMDSQTSFVEVAEKRMSSFNGQLISLKGSIESLLITAFTPFIETLTPMITKVITIVNGIRTWVENNQELTQRVLHMTTALIALGPTLFAVGKGVSLFGFLIASLVNPLNLVLLAVSGFTAAFIGDFGGIRTALQPTLDRFKIFFEGLKTQFDQVGFKKMFEPGRLTGIFTRFLFALGLDDDVIQDTVKLFAGIGTTIKDVFKGVGNVISRVSSVLAPLFREIRYFLQDINFGFLITGLQDFLGISGEIASTVGSQVLSAFEIAVGGVREFFVLLRYGMSIWDIFSMVTGNPEWLQTLQTGFLTVVGGIQNFFLALRNGMTIWNSLVFATGNPEWLQALRKAFFIISDWINFQVIPALSKLKTWFVDTGMPAIIGFIRDSVIPAFFKLINWLIVHIPTALQILSGVWTNQLYPVLSNTWSYLTSTLFPSLQKLWNWFQDKLPGAVTVASNFWSNTLLPAIKKVWSFITTFLLPKFLELVNWMILKIPVAIDTFANLWNNTLSPALKTAWDWLGKFLNLLGPEFLVYVGGAALVIMGLQTAFSVASVALTGLTLAFSPLGVALIAGGILVLAYKNNWLRFKDFVDGPVMTSINNVIDGLRRWRDALNDVGEIIRGIQNGDWNIGDVTRQFGISASSEFGFGPQQIRNNPIQAGAKASGFFNALQNPLASLGKFVGQNLPRRDSGGRGLAGNPYMIGRGAQPELFVPQTNGTFIPNADQLGSQTQYHFTIENITANSEAEGRAAADGFHNRIMELVRTSG